MSFYNRSRELKLLDKVYSDQPAGQLFVLYGRRRVGKTALLAHWTNTRRHRTLYFTADRTTAANQIRAMSHALERFLSPGSEPDAGFSYLTWDRVFDKIDQAARLANERIVVVLDEFTYAIESDPSLPSILQRKWDHQIKRADVMLVLTGSHAGMIEREVLAFRSPLYNRATHSLHLQPMSFGCLADFFPRYTAEERLTIYGCLGGIPQYFELLQPERPLDDNLRDLLTTSMILDDAGALLRDQLSEPRNYVAIVEAIAAGFTRTTEIATMSGLPTTHASKYLSVLQHLGIVARDVPATVSRPERSKQGRYRITDAYLRFYYRFLAPARSELNRGRVNQVWANMRQHLAEFIGAHAFEELCREWVSIQGDRGKLPFVPRRVGSYWAHKGPQIDVLAVNEDEHAMLVGECKWTNERVGRSIVLDLPQKAARIIPDPGGKWKITYALFSKSGFTGEAHRAARELDCLWVDMQQLDRELRE